MAVRSITKKMLSCLAIATALALAGCASGEAAAQSDPVSAATAPNQAVPTAQTSSGSSTASDPAPAAVCTKLNLNLETEGQLMSTIPNFSTRMVREFLEYRPYLSIQQFRREIGKYVDTNQVTEWEKYVYVPVDPNQSDADTLMQIPGVDSTVANSLIAGRPYASTQAFTDALSKSISADQGAQAACYLAQ